MPHRIAPWCIVLLAVLGAAAAPDLSGEAVVRIVAPGRDWLPPGTLGEKLAGADYILLGEIHDNPGHHRLQARILDAVAANGRAALVLEMVPRSLQPAIDAYLESPGARADGFGAAVSWEERGWPDFAIYRPLLEVAIARGVPVRAGDIGRDAARAMAKGGAGPFAPSQRRRLGLDEPLPQALAGRLRSALALGHCGLLPEAALDPMMEVQRARDAALADAMLAARRDGAAPVVLIAGSGHVRRDYAVPRILARLDPGARTVAVAIAERGEGAQPQSYLAPDGQGGFAYDLAIVTPGAERDDPCLELRAPKR